MLGTQAPTHLPKRQVPRQHSPPPQQSDGVIPPPIRWWEARRATGRAWEGSFIVNLQSMVARDAVAGYGPREAGEPAPAAGCDSDQMQSAQELAPMDARQATQGPGPPAQAATQVARDAAQAIFLKTEQPEGVTAMMARAMPVWRRMAGAWGGSIIVVSSLWGRSGVAPRPAVLQADAVRQSCQRTAQDLAGDARKRGQGEGAP